MPGHNIQEWPNMTQASNLHEPPNTQTDHNYGHIALPVSVLYVIAQLEIQYNVFTFATLKKFTLATYKKFHICHI